MSNIWQQINDSAAGSVQQIQQSLVQIVSDEGSMGAGIIWKSDGIIITNAHVVMGRNQVRDLQVVLQDGEPYDAQIVVADETLDIAVLSISANDLPIVKVGSSANLVVGQWLMAIGHPWGILDAITAGVVIGTGNKLPEIGDKRDWIAVDMKMRPGHSGGALFNQDGEVVGINTMIQGPEVSFAVPIDVVKQFLKNTIEADYPPKPVEKSIETITTI